MSVNTVAAIMAEHGSAGAAAAAAAADHPARAGPVAGSGPGRTPVRRRRRQPASGSATAPRSTPTRASCTWTACSISGPGGWSGSPCRPITTPTWPTRRCRWRSRSAAARTAVAGVILHSDQGSEYTAHRFRAACHRMGVRQSMGRPGSALDNAVIESWHSTLEFELRSLRHFTTQGPGPGRGRGVDRRLQPEPATLRARHALPDRLRTPADRARAGRGMTCVPTAHHGAASPASRPSPSGGLRPALTPAPGGTNRQPSERRERPNKIKSH